MAVKCRLALCSWLLERDLDGTLIKTSWLNDCVHAYVEHPLLLMMKPKIWCGASTTHEHGILPIRVRKHQNTAQCLRTQDLLVWIWGSIVKKAKDSRIEEVSAIVGRASGGWRC